jgi:hypothetical protein
MASPSPVFTTFLTRSGRKSQETLSKTWSVNMAKFICEVITKGCRLLREKTQETPEICLVMYSLSFAPGRIQQ